MTTIKVSTQEELENVTTMLVEAHPDAVAVTRDGDEINLECATMDNLEYGLLIWETEEDSINDDGQYAIAEIVRR